MFGALGTSVASISRRSVPTCKKVLGLEIPGGTYVFLGKVDGRVMLKDKGFGCLKFEEQT